MHINRKRLPHLAAGILKTGTIVECEIHRLRVQHLASRAIFRHLAGGQHTGDFILGDFLPFEFDRSVQPIRARQSAGETGNHVIDPNLGHLLRRLNGGADGALGFLHG